MMLNSNLFIFACKDLLAIKKPIEIRMLTKDRKAVGHKHAPAAFYEPRYRKGRIVGHVIFVNLSAVVESDYAIADVIAHEICHAAQFEHGIFRSKKHHDEKFQKLCAILEADCARMGFALGKLYDPETDTD